jgi:hypothetical protein
VTNYYVYYRIDPAQLGKLGIEITKLFRKVEKESGVRGRWMRRRDEPTTYMEVYEGVRDADAFDALLQGQCERLALQRFLAPGAVRRREIFIAAETPA